MKTQKIKSKRTYSHDDLRILLLKESFNRDLNLFKGLITATKGFFDKPWIDPTWTFTVVESMEGSKELIVNVPPKK